MTGSPLVFAHRGACRQAPENSLAAFAAARRLGADGVELDVRRSADGVLVVHHDPVRPGVGALAGLPFAELRSRSPEVPTLDEALEELRGLLVNIEIKCLPWEDDHDPERPEVAGVVDAVTRHAVVADVIVSSFDLESVNAMRVQAPHVATGWLTMGRDPVESVRVAADLGHRWLHPDAGTMAVEATAGAAVEAGRTLGVRLDVWTVDEPDQLRALAAAAVDAVITNVPDLARQALA